MGTDSEHTHPYVDTAGAEAERSAFLHSPEPLKQSDSARIVALEAELAEMRDR